MGKDLKFKLPYLILTLYICVKHYKYPYLFIKLNEEISRYLIGVIIFFLSFGSLFLTQLLTSWKHWALLTILLLIELYYTRLFCLNSSYLYRYFVIAFVLSFKESTLEARQVFWGKSARLLLFVALFFAGLQKAFCEYYREGNLILTITFKKSFFLGFLGQFHDSFIEVFNQYKSSYNLMKKFEALDFRELPITIPKKLILMSYLMSMSSIVLELVLAFLCLKKKSYKTPLTFALSIALVLGIYLLTNELLFLALVCLLSYFGHECQGRKARIFVGCFCYFFIAHLTGYRPFFLS